MIEWFEVVAAIAEASMQNDEAQAEADAAVIEASGPEVQALFAEKK